ncbi:Hypothetical protein NTJ_06407 [Nesidiocoris tenuis]|uniref:DUF4203 domain-containing protein n=1 Tax=Nesidiocoris tenuis TaxID=355587 RepID=A0ABN7AMY4_9HEMI|nr:Hypothetical protein NTJ_06407 [Nesidiocoris tenuis]
MGNQIKTIIKMVAFGLVCATFALSIFVHKHFIGFSSTLAGATAGGFFGVYLADFVGFLSGDQVEQENLATWAIYGSCSFLGFGASILDRTSGSDDTEIFMCFLSGIMAVCSAVICFFDALIG